MIRFILIISIFLLAGCSNDDNCPDDEPDCEYVEPEPDSPEVTVIGEWIEVEPGTQCETLFLFDEDGFFETESLNKVASGLYAVNPFGDRIMFSPAFDNGGENCRDGPGLVSGGAYSVALTIIDKNEILLSFPVGGGNGGLEDRELNRKRK